MKILFIHVKYQQQGGEDSVLKYESELLEEKNKVEILLFENGNGLKGAIQFLFSIWNIFAANKVKKKMVMCFNY